MYPVDDSSVPPCTNSSQVKRFLDTVTDIRKDMTNLMLIEKTGCKPNCVAYKYDVQKVVEWDSVHYYGFGKI